MDVTSERNDSAEKKIAFTRLRFSMLLFFDVESIRGFSGEGRREKKAFHALIVRGKPTVKRDK